MTKTLFLDAGWKRWVAENTLRGAPAEELTRVLVGHGFDESHARLEVDTAQTHPYVAAASSVVRQLKKRDWVLHNQRLLTQSATSAVDEIRGSIDLNQFFDSYYALNRPLVIRGALQDWPAMQKWTMEYLIQRGGNREVEVQANRDSNSDYEINNLDHATTSAFDDFARKVFTEGETNDFYMTANNGNANEWVMDTFGEDIHPLPNMLDSRQGTARTFFWMGPAGTVTPLHHDLTNNLMAQVVGRKRLKLIAPCALPLVYNHLHCYSRVDPENIDLEKYPLFRHVRVIDVTIGPGDILFLPVGWWHHVRGLDPTITITATSFRWPNQYTEYYHTHGEI